MVKLRNTASLTLTDLLEPFLLPSLVVSLQWIAKHLWQTTTISKISLSLLQSLTKPPSSTEAREIHQTILSLVADPLNLQLRAVGDEHPQKQEAIALVNALGPYVALSRNTTWLSDDTQSSGSFSGGLLSSLRQTFHLLLAWSTALEMNSSPPKFTFNLVLAAVHVHGATKVLLMFLEELKILLGTTRLAAAIDIIASIICAPFPISHGPAHCLSFRQALKTLHADLAMALKKGDSVFAEALVRLHHRVEALSAAVAQQEIPIDPGVSIAADLSDVDLQNINLDAAAGNAEVDVGSLGVQPTSEDIDQILEGATMMENFGTNTMGSGTDDVFGLESGDMQMMNFDDMDLEGMF